MSDAIKHECGIALLRLKKPLSYFEEKYGSALFGINKMYLMMEKQHNRGQDGAGFASIKFDMEPGERYISRVRSCEKQPIQDIFNQICRKLRTLDMRQMPKLVLRLFNFRICKFVFQNYMLDRVWEKLCWKEESKG